MRNCCELGGKDTSIYLEIQLLLKNISYFNLLYLVIFALYYLVFPDFYWAVEQALNPTKRTAIKTCPLHETGAVLKGI